MTSEARNAELARALLGCTYQELTPVQRSVIDLIADEAPSGLNPQLSGDDRTFWERLADTIAAVGGSWRFIFAFLGVLAAWVSWNAIASTLAFDPYPFIFLNLVMSMIAALQAPVIMMSQNRAAARDRLNAEHDYVVNPRAELEIMHLHDKLDALRSEELVAMVKAQNETLELLKAQMAALAAAKFDHEVVE
jgi:uncharacterized membrane protein